MKKSCRFSLKTNTTKKAKTSEQRFAFAAAQKHQKCARQNGGSHPSDASDRHNRRPRQTALRAIGHSEPPPAARRCDCSCVRRNTIGRRRYRDSKPTADDQTATWRWWLWPETLEKRRTERPDERRQRPRLVTSPSPARLCGGGGRKDGEQGERAGSGGGGGGGSGGDGRERYVARIFAAATQKLVIVRRARAPIQPAARRSPRCKSPLYQLIDRLCDGDMRARKKNDDDDDDESATRERQMGAKKRSRLASKLGIERHRSDRRRRSRFFYSFNGAFDRRGIACVACSFAPPSASFDSTARS